MDDTERYIRTRQLVRAEVARDEVMRVFESLEDSPDHPHAITALFAKIAGQLKVAITLLEERDEPPCRHCGQVKKKHAIRNPIYPDIDPPGHWCREVAHKQYEAYR
jgi:hypothetical protein